MRVSFETQGPDSEETREWLEALDEVLRSDGPQRCQELLRRLIDHVRNHGIQFGITNSPYRNSIPVGLQPIFPGDLALERRITAIVRWNALAMVVRANKHSSELGGHLSSYASAADLFEVGFNHFFRGNRGELPSERSGDLVFFQPHSAPGIYARAFLEGRISEDQLANFRQETSGRGLCSYPHPWLMPDFWQFPTGSMGLGVINAVYQARFMRYLEHRGLMKPSDRKVWAFVGDGEMDEPESSAGLVLAARENLDNLIFVVNCNLQRLDGPVRGNGKIVQELERLFGGAGWNVIKLLWGSGWDDLFANDPHNLILERLEEVVDGELQSYGAHDGSYNRRNFFNKTEQLAQLVSKLSDGQIEALDRGGHDPLKIHAAFAAAIGHRGHPTVVLALTKKGYGLGRWAESRMSAHQQKSLGTDALLSFRDRFELPLSDDEVCDAKFYRPPDDSTEMAYLRNCRRNLGGFVPTRARKAGKIDVPPLEEFASFTLIPESREMSTTVAFVRMLTGLLKNEKFAEFIAPIVCDEARTFGMESLFRKIGIYSHCGQLYEPEDRLDLLYYKESCTGQILEEGITEAGALSSWIAAGTAYSHHGIPMLPFYIYYSIFGFQRVGDLIWAAADSRARGFLLGGTAGRTSLSGEGLQHQDGTSHLIASTIPSCRAYDPCFAYEVAVILEHGMRAMLEAQEDVFYYLTLMNEKYVHPPMPVGVKEGILHGMYCVRTSSLTKHPVKGSNQRKSSASIPHVPRVQLLGSGTILREVLAAAELLERDWGIAADVWSVTSFTQLRHSGLEVERWNRIHPDEKPRSSWVEQCLDRTEGPVIAASDYVRTVPDLIRTWVRPSYVTLGTDGFGLSDTRAALRRFFEVDSTSIAYASLKSLADAGIIGINLLRDFMKRYSFEPADSHPWNDRRDAIRPNTG